MTTLLRTAVLVLSVMAASPATADGGAGRFWRSLLIPGLGQHAGGDRSSAIRFIATEGALWAGYTGLSSIARIRRDTYRTYATAHSGAQTSGKSKQYFDDLGFYNNHHEHNQFASVDDGPRATLYANTPEFSWEWDKDSSRERYRELRNATQSMERNALYMTGFVVINHLFSAIHAGRMDRGDGLSDTDSTSGDLASISIDWQLRSDRLDLVLSHRL